MSKQIAVLGAGSWGSVLANVLTENGHHVTLWTRSAEQAAEMNTHHTNQKYVHDFEYESALTATTEMEQAIAGADMILLAIPTKGLRQVAHQLGQLLATMDIKPVITHVTKGLEQGTYKRPSEMIAEELPADHYQGITVLSGPSHAESVALHDMTAVTIAANDEQLAKDVQGLFMNQYFRAYTNNDVVGVEVAAALKNVIAIGSGILSGLGYKDNARAALITRGLAEIRRFGVSFGANPMTFIGLAGVGDLVVTATSQNSRNYRCGFQLGQGQSVAEIEANMGMVIEGLSTVKVAHEIAEKRHVSMPITDAIYKVVYEGQAITEVVTELMGREGTTEVE